MSLRLAAFSRSTRLRSQALRWAAVAVLGLSLLAAACGSRPAAPGDAGGDAPGTEAPPAPTVLVVAKSQEPESLDPHKTIHRTAGEIYENLYERLVYLDADGAPQGWLAERWAISDDGKTITFTLRTGRRFHDGTPVDAEAVKFSFDRIKDPATASPAAAEFRLLERVEVVDSRTVRLVFSAPYAPVWSSLAGPNAGIVSPAAVAAGGGGFGRSPVGSGPFVFESWVPGEVRLRANPDYTNVRADVKNPGPPHLARLVFRIIGEEGTLLAGLESGALHLSEAPLEELARLDADPRFQVLALRKAFNVVYVEFNAKKPPFDDLRVRRAVGYALDPEEIRLVAWAGHAEINRTPLPVGVFGHDPAVAAEVPYRRDVARARALLREAGWQEQPDGSWRVDGKPVELPFLVWSEPAAVRAAETIQAQLLDIGIVVRVQSLEPATLIPTLRDGKGTFNLMRWTRPDPSILATIFLEGGAWKQYQDPDLDELLRKVDTTVDPEARRRWIRAAQLKVLEDAAMIPLLTTHVATVARAEVGGFRWDGLGREIYNDLLLGGAWGGDGGRGGGPRPAPRPPPPPTTMAQYAARRLLLMIPVLLGVSLLVFLLRAVVPGDPVEVMFFGQIMDEATIQGIRRELGLDRPLPVQYLRYLGRVVRGDLGTSIRTRRPVAVEVLERYPNTLALAGGSLAVAAAAGGVLGVASAVRRGSWLDLGSMTAALVGLSMPSFWLGLVLINTFGVRLRWLPVMGSGTPAHLVLPAATLGLLGAAIVARMVRSAMLDVLGQEFIRTARAKGLPERVIVFRHAMRNALIPVVTILGLQFGFLLGGAFVVEIVFVYPGVGELALNAITMRDFPVLQGILLLVAATYVLVNTAVDLTYGALDPRIRYR